MASTAQQQRLLDTVAALSGEIHSSPDFQGFYTRMGKQGKGCAEIWQLCVDAAELFQRVEAKLNVGDRYDFIEAMEGYANRILAMGYFYEDLEAAAEEAIHDAIAAAFREVEHAEAA